MTTNDDETVRRLLAALGIEPPADEVDEMVKSYPTLRAAADSLYSPDVMRFVPSHLINDRRSTRANAEAK